MTMTEEAVEARFVDYLMERGWVIELTDPTDYTDLVARRGAELLVCELKGMTKSPETAVDIGYGQLLRAMTRYPDASYALVVPEALVPKAERVSIAVRRRLGLDIYVVPDIGEVYQR